MPKGEYRISIDKEDWVTPEETLLDSVSDHSDLERPISDGVFKFLSFALVIIAGVIFAFTFKIAVIESEELSKIAVQNRSASFQIPPPRGIIFDKSGVALTNNVPNFDLLVISKELRDNKENFDLNLSKIAEILKQNAQDFRSKITEQLDSNSVFFAAHNLSKEQLLAVNYLNPAGFYVIADTKRYYVGGSQLAPIVGYTGRVNQEDLEGDHYYLPTDMVGRAGIEAEYEKVLRGEHGVIFFGENQENNFKEANAGDSVILNIDYAAQKVLYSSLYKELGPTALDRASAIVQNPQNGEVIALVSFPSYDNNLFQDGLSASEFKKLFENKSKPLFNRVISGTYNPGSTIKPFMGMAILQEDIFEPSDNIRDCIGLTVSSPGGGQERVFKNWRAETGLFNLRKAIANSCNVYFFIGGGGYGKIVGLGVERIANYLKNSLADSILGIDLPGEVAGFVPTPAWKETERGEDWYQGDTYNISIGQGDLSVTPLWLNSYIGAIANGGTIYKPRVASRIIDGKNNTLKIFEPEVLKRLPFREDVINELRLDMEETVLSGTAKILQEVPVRTGAKTGTAEVVKGVRINSLFTAFAPLDKAEVVITVLVEGSASNEGYATRTANNFLRWYFGERNRVKN